MELEERNLITLMRFAKGIRAIKSIAKNIMFHCPTSTRVPYDERL